MHPDDPVRPEPGAVEVAVRADSGAAVVRVAGDVDAAAVDAVRGAISEALRGTPRAVVLDLSGVALLASAGMTLLLEASEDLRDRGVPLLLAASARTVRRPLRLTGLDRVLTLHDDVRSALVAVPAADHGEADHG